LALKALPSGHVTVRVWNIRMPPAEQHITLADHYTMLSTRFRAKAKGEKSPRRKAELEQLADCYGRLAKHPHSFDEPHVVGSMP